MDLEQGVFIHKNIEESTISIDKNMNSWIYPSWHGMKPWFGKNIDAKISPIKFSLFGSRAGGFYSQKHVFVFLRLILTIESASKNWRVNHFHLQKHEFMNLSIMAWNLDLARTSMPWYLPSSFHNLDLEQGVFILKNMFLCFWDWY